jgi:hypothetical protein
MRVKNGLIILVPGASIGLAGLGVTGCASAAKATLSGDAVKTEFKNASFLAAELHNWISKTKTLATSAVPAH